MGSFDKAKQDQIRFKLNIRDTAFLLKVLSQAAIKIEDARQAEVTVNKIKSCHERLMEYEINPIGK